MRQRWDAVSHVDAQIVRSSKGVQFCYPIPSSLKISLTHKMQTNRKRERERERERDQFFLYIYRERERDLERAREKYREAEKSICRAFD